MKKHKSWYLPDWETHFVEIMNQKNIDGYQIEGRTVSIKESLKLNGWQPKLAIDVGANVGFWSRDLCEKFEKVRQLTSELTHHCDRCLEVDHVGLLEKDVFG